MEMIIDDNFKLCEIQNVFSKHFPYLKLKFFKFELAEKKVFLNKNRIKDLNKTIRAFHHVHYPGYISINCQQKVTAVIYHFKTNLGINVQVLRKSGNIWQQTVDTDDWTLSEQNIKGGEMDKMMMAQIAEYDHYQAQL